jgi:hypothetical protein
MSLVHVFFVHSLSRGNVAMLEISDFRLYNFVDADSFPCADFRRSSMPANFGAQGALGFGFLAVGSQQDDPSMQLSQRIEDLLQLLCYFIGLNLASFYLRTIQEKEREREERENR